MVTKRKAETIQALKFAIDEQGNARQLYDSTTFGSIYPYPKFVWKVVPTLSTSTPPPMLKPSLVNTLAKLGVRLTAEAKYKRLKREGQEVIAQRERLQVALATYSAPTEAAPTNSIVFSNALASAPRSNPVVSWYDQGTRIGTEPPTPNVEEVAPTAVAPKAVTPKAVAPKAVAPKTVAPKAVTPKAVAPKAVTPKAVSPKVIAPKAVSPKAVAPKAVAPKTVAPKAVASKVVTPTAVAPKAVAPKAATPKAVVPKAVASAAAPSASGKIATQPATSNPEDATPDAAAMLSKFTAAYEEKEQMYAHALKVKAHGAAAFGGPPSSVMVVDNQALQTAGWEGSLARVGAAKRKPRDAMQRAQERAQEEFWAAYEVMQREERGEQGLPEAPVQKHARAVAPDEAGPKRRGGEVSPVMGAVSGISAVGLNKGPRDAKQRYKQRAEQRKREFWSAFETMQRED